MAAMQRIPSLISEGRSEPGTNSAYHTAQRSINWQSTMQSETEPASEQLAKRLATTLRNELAEVFAVSQELQTQRLNAELRSLQRNIIARIGPAGPTVDAHVPASIQLAFREGSYDLEPPEPPESCEAMAVRINSVPEETEITEINIDSRSAITRKDIIQSVYQVMGWSHVTNGEENHTISQSWAIFTKDTRHGCSNFRRLLERVVDSTRFTCMIMAVILTNALVLGVQVEMEARFPTWDRQTMEAVQLGFQVCFMLELALRFFAKGPAFMTGVDRDWNLFDTAVVAAGVVEMVLSRMGDLKLNLSIFRVIRIVRLCRVFRIFRLITLMRELQKMAFSIFYSLRALFWSVVLMLIVMYVFGLWFTQATADYLADAQRASDQEVWMSENMVGFFGGISSSVYTLYIAVSGGISWGEVTDAVGLLGPLHVVLFLVYMTFMLFAMMNIVTGVFVETALASAQRERDFMIMEQMERRDSEARQLAAIFRDIDADGSNLVSLEEFEDAMKDPRVVAQLCGLGLSPEEARGLFRLLDLEGHQQINIDEFVAGCFRFKGAAKQLDVAMMMYENKKMVDKWNYFIKFMKHEMKGIHMLVRNLTAVDQPAAHKSGQMYH